LALTYTPAGELGSKAQDFDLLGVDGKRYRLLSFSESKALVVVFMCNHCPYVIAVQKRINELAREYAQQSVALVGINSNDSTRYPADNFAAMQERAREEGYVFPYLHDETQTVARAYGAVCTPDFFVYAKQDQIFILHYRGRLDDQWRDEKAVTRRELASALDAILIGQYTAGNQVPAQIPSQIPSMGCSIKWR